MALDQFVLNIRFDKEHQSIAAMAATDDDNNYENAKKVFILRQR